MASRKEYEMLFQLNAQLGGSYNSTFKSAQTTISSMQREIQALGKTQGDISAYQKQQSAVDATRQKLAVLQEQYDNIQREIRETGEYSSSLQNKLLSKQQQIDRTSASLERQTQKLGQMDTALREAGVNTGNLERESARLGEKMTDLKARQEQAAEGATGFGDASAQAFGAIQQAIVAAGIVTALKEIYDAYMECVGAAGDFEEAMSTVEALSGATGEELASLTAMAKELGATTKFTAQESADAMGFMAMAGWDVNDMLSGMDGVLQLAAASGEDLAMVSDIVTDSLSAFGLKASDTAHFSDVLAAAATNSNTNVAIMGETFKMSASVAGALGYSIEDVALAVGLMANTGVKGSIAGTALKNTFNGLLEGVTLTSAAFGEYEYSAIMADGTMKTFGDTIDELRVCFGQMTEAERVNNAMALAGKRGYNGLLGILNATEEDYSSLSESINDCSGAASKMASIKLDNMNGELTLMKSAWEALTISLGEQSTPVMRELYALGAEVFSGLSRFVDQHPALVKAIAAFLGVMGTAVTVITLYTAATKVAAAVSAAFATATGVALGPIIAVVTAVAALTAGIVAICTSAEDTIPSVEELTSAAREMSDAMQDAADTYDETMTNTLATASVAEKYIGKLEEMEAAGIATDEQARQYHGTLMLLCETVPELAEYIDLENDAIRGGTAALRDQVDAWRETAIAQAYQDQLTAIYKKQSDVLIEAEKNRMKLTDAEYRREEAVRKVQETQEKMNRLWAEAEAAAAAYTRETGVGTDAMHYLTDEYYNLHDSLSALDNDVWEAEETVTAYQKAIKEGTDVAEEAQAQIDLTEQAIKNLTGATDEGAGADEDAARQKEELLNTISDMAGELEALTTSYEEAYNAAYDSISGQYALWDKVKDPVATSASTINSALESQITYWQNYNANLEKLTGRSAEIEGLSDVIASFADGSKDSVSAIAGMASASDDDLAAMVANWQELQAEQENASNSIAELETNFSASLAELQQEFENAVADMDLGEAAAESGRNTIEGLISGTEDMLPLVYDAYAKVAQTGMDAIDARLKIHSPSRVMMEKAEMTWAGYINQTEAMTPDIESAMAEAAGAGASAVGGGNAGAAVSAELGGAPSVAVQFSPQYNISGAASAPELEAVLQEHDNELRDYIAQVVTDAVADAERRAYK